MGDAELGGRYRPSSPVTATSHEEKAAIRSQHTGTEGPQGAEADPCTGSASGSRRRFSRSGDGLHATIGRAALVSPDFVIFVCHG